jgi:hypothetical protein
VWLGSKGLGLAVSRPWSPISGWGAGQQLSWDGSWEKEQLSYAEEQVETKPGCEEICTYCAPTVDTMAPMTSQYPAALSIQGPVKYSRAYLLRAPPAPATLHSSPTPWP